MHEPKPDAVGTTNALACSVVRVDVARRYTVCYEFDTSATNVDLQLPYAVAVDGVPHPDYVNKPRRLDRSRKITIVVASGSEVALFLNSDAHPGYRQHPVYSVRVDANDVLVKIVEQKGRAPHHQAVLSVPPARRRSAPDCGKLTDVYSSVLTGDIWMRVSHQYTAAEAEQLMPASAAPTVREAVMRIYRGLPSKELMVKFPLSETAQALIVTLSFADADNPPQHIASFSLLRDGLSRVHLQAYVALLTAARAASVSRIRITSGWRPMLGSIAHRAGLGLDVDYIEAADTNVHINRVALTKPRGTVSDTVSEKEKELYREYEAAKAETKRRKAEYFAAQTKVERNKDASAAIQLEQSLDAAKAGHSQAVKQEEKCQMAWDSEAKRNEPAALNRFRQYLQRDPDIGQLLDPWYIDLNTQDSIAAAPNEQRSADEKLHANHLHITVSEPKIL